MRQRFHRNNYHEACPKNNDKTDDKAFNQPRLALNRIYTKRGDAGETSLVGGQRVAKDDPRIEAYGTVDELNAFTGLARVSCQEAGRRLGALASILRRVQHELFNLGSILATQARGRSSQAGARDGRRGGAAGARDRRDERGPCPAAQSSCCRAGRASMPSCTSRAPSAAARNVCW